MKQLLFIFLTLIIIGCSESNSINKENNPIEKKKNDSTKTKDSIPRSVSTLDSLKKPKLNERLLIAQKSLDSIYSIWRVKKIDSLKMFENELANNSSEWEIKRKTTRIKSTIDLVDWLISFDKEKFLQKSNSSKDTVKEVKDLIKNLVNTPPDKWKEMGLIHPLVGYSIYTTPAAHIYTHRLHGSFDNIDGWIDINYVHNYFKALFNHIDHPDFESILIKKKSKGIVINDMGWGGDGYMHIGFQDYVGYMVFDYFQQCHAFNFTDSLNVFFDKGLIDTNRLDWYKKRMEPYDYDLSDNGDKEIWRIIINSLSKTNSKNLALFIIGVDNGNINFNLLNKTSKLIFIEGETISFKGNGEHGNGPTFKRINGKLYFYELDQMDVNGCIECCSIEWFDYYDKKSDCYLFK